MTQRHSERVAGLAPRLAMALGWRCAAADRLREAALVHDVGKIAVPDTILSKPGALDAGEYALVKEHAALGAAIAGEILDDDQVSWIRHHHERWDGCGYPDGLSGQAIPEGAQLLAAADAWDALTSDRPYHPRASVADALAECRRVAGSQLAPRAVTALLAVVLAGC